MAGEVWMFGFGHWGWGPRMIHPACPAQGVVTFFGSRLAIVFGAMRMGGVPLGCMIDLSARRSPDEEACRRSTKMMMLLSK